MSATSDIHVRDYVEADRQHVLDVLADAFTGFPPIDVIAGTDAGARDRRRRLFETDLQPAARHHVLVAETSGRVKGVLTFADSPACSAMSPRLMLTFLRIAGPRIFSTLDLYRKVDGAHLRRPHRHLVAIGVDPASQRSGIGSALTQEYGRRCDDEALDGYLESIRWSDPARPSHERFYRRHGFEIASEIPVSADWTGLTMLRPARSRPRT